jgi:hypothetical protein
VPGIGWPIFWSTRAEHDIEKQLAFAGSSAMIRGPPKGALRPLSKGVRSHCADNPSTVERFSSGRRCPAPTRQLKRLAVKELASAGEANRPGGRLMGPKAHHPDPCQSAPSRGHGRLRSSRGPLRQGYRIDPKTLRKHYKSELDKAISRRLPRSPRAFSARRREKARNL